MLDCKACICGYMYTCWNLLNLILHNVFVWVCVRERREKERERVFKVFTWVASFHVCVYFQLFLAMHKHVQYMRSHCSRACMHSHILWSLLCHALLPITPQTPTSTEPWPHTFLPCALLSPSLCPFLSSSPCLSLFCVSTDVWNYSGMEGWIPPWWAEWRREPFVQ